MRKASFEPITGPDTRLLILGTLPGEVSLARSQYYANPRNQFWRLMAVVLADTLAEATSYDERLGAIGRRGVGLWDVVRSAQRIGSLDVNIREHEPNALPQLVDALPDLAAVAFNGRTASGIGRKLLAGFERLHMIDLPSSSPANTTPFDRKIAGWLALCPFVLPPPELG